MIDYQNDTLFIEDLPLTEIAQQFGTPCYVYSEAALTAAFEAYRSAFKAQDPLICYAVKANSNLSMVIGRNRPPSISLR